MARDGRRGTKRADAAKARAGIRAYTNGMGACRLDMNVRPAGEILWFVCRACRACRAARTENPRRGRGGRSGGRYACRAARTEPPAGGEGGVWGRYARRAARTENPAGGNFMVCLPRPRPCRVRARRTEPPAGGGGRSGALCLSRRAHGKPPPGAGGVRLGALCSLRRDRAVPARPLIARPAGEILWFARAALSRTGRTRPRSSSGTPCPQTAGRAARACSPCDRSADPCSGRP